MLLGDWSSPMEPESTALSTRRRAPALGQSALQAPELQLQDAIHTHLSMPLMEGIAPAAHRCAPLLWQ
jgi:hypothetical protein